MSRVSTPSRGGKHEPSAGSRGARTAPALGQKQPWLAANPAARAPEIQDSSVPRVTTPVLCPVPTALGKTFREHRRPVLWPGLRFQSFLALLQDPSLESLPSSRGQSHPVTRPPGTGPGASSLVSPQPLSLLLPFPVPAPHSDSSPLLPHHPDTGHVGVHLASCPTAASTCVLPPSSFFPTPVGLIFLEAISFLSLEACETFS